MAATEMAQKKKIETLPGIPKIPYALAVFGKEEIDAVTEVMQTPMIGPGKYVSDFIEKIASLFGKKYGVMTNSGSSANLLALRLIDLPKGSEVITPTLTFGTTVSPIFQLDLVPVFVDSVMGTYQLDVDQVERAISNKTKAIMAPSLIGNIPDYKRLRDIADRNKLWLIEDSADTLGATIYGKPTGEFTDISTTSFYASHIITTGGHGGALTFNHEFWKNKAITLAGWGRASSINETESTDFRFSYDVDGIAYDAKYVFQESGYNVLSSNIDAAFGLAQLQKFDEFSRQRQENFKSLLSFFYEYTDFFIPPVQESFVNTNWLAFPLTITEEAGFTRRQIAHYLEQNGIQTRPLFAGNIMRHPAFQKLPHKKLNIDYSVANYVMEHSFLVGCNHGLTEQHIEYMKSTIKEFITSLKK